MSSPKKKQAAVAPQAAVQKPKQSINEILFRYRYIPVGIALFFSLFFAFMIFDYKISMNGDDSAYIQRAWNLIHQGVFPTFQGPIYPIFLTIPISIFGLNITILKWASLLSITASIFVFFKAFEKHVPMAILLPVIVLTGINIHLLYYSSQTFSEGFFMLLQALFLWAFTASHLKSGKIKEEMPLYAPALLGAFIVFLMLTRSVGVAALVALVVFYGLHQQWKNIASSILGFGATYGIFTFVKKTFWDKIEEAGSQLEILTRVDPYNADAGTETVAGYVGRLFDNADIYISKLFYTAIALRAEDAGVSRILALLTVAVLVFATYITWKHSKALFLMLLYTGASCGLTFIILQKVWGQERLIIIFLPCLLAGILSAIYYLSYFKSIGGIKWFYALFAVVLALPLMARATQKIQDYSLVRSMNQQGDLLYGLNPDMRNYIEMSRWCKTNLPNAYVAVRKPTISFVYAEGHNFYGIFSVPSENADSLLKPLRDNKVTHVMDASIRTNPDYNNGQVIGTISRYLYYIEQQYPGTFKLIQELGADEKARVYEINYPNER